MKALVTGGAGFIGSHIVDALLAKSHAVVIVDNLVTGSRDNLNPAATFYRADIGGAEMAGIFEQEKPDIVFHHAAHTLITRSVTDPVYDLRENIAGSVNIIVNCRNFKVKKLIYASSVAVYGEPQYLPVDEGHLVNPISPYGISKHTVEHYLFLYRQQHQLDYTVLRYTNIYGPRQNASGEGGVIAIFARQMAQGERPTIFGPGDKTRDYLHVSDVVKANLLAAERGANTVYNIGTGVRTSDQAVFDNLAGLLGYKAAPRYEAVRPGEIYHMCLNAGKAQQELGWTPQMSFEEGLKQTIGYYRDRFGHKQ